MAKMEILKETTGQVGDFRYPENIYILNSAGKLVGYRREGEGFTTYFEKPMAFDKRRRTFIKLESVNEQ